MLSCDVLSLYFFYTPIFIFLTYLSLELTWFVMHCCSWSSPEQGGWTVILLTSTIPWLWSTKETIMENKRMTMENTLCLLEEVSCRTNKYNCKSNLTYLPQHRRCKSQSERPKHPARHIIWLYFRIRTSSALTHLFC